MTLRFGLLGLKPNLIFKLSKQGLTIKVCDIILRPPEEKLYNTLKEQLIKQTAASEQRCLQQSLDAEEFGDHKPTQLLHWLQY